MIKRSKIRPRPVAVRPSRIRREPIPVGRPQKAAEAYPTEREAWVVAVGVVLFALAIAVIIVGVSDYTSH